MQEAALPIIDPAIIEDDFMNDRGLLREVFDSFLTQYEQHMSDLQTALSQKSHRELGSAAHKLKGGLMYIGAAAAAKTAELVEASAIENDLDAAQDACDCLQCELSRLLPAFENYLSQA